MLIVAKARSAVNEIVEENRLDTGSQNFMFLRWK